MRTALAVVLLVVAGFVGFSWWTGAAPLVPLQRPADAPIGTSGSIDITKARERGAEVGEKAAEAVESIRETVEDSRITSKIKAKMALDDTVRARAIDVSTNGPTVTLSGTVLSQAEHDRAVSLARETTGVSRVIDQLRVR